MQKSSVLLGIIIAVICFQFFTLADVCIKWLTVGYSAMQILFLSSLVGLFVIATPVIIKGKTKDLKPNNFSQHLIRTFYGAASAIFGVFALRYVDLSSFLIITYTTPLFGVFLAYFLLNESIKPSTLLAVLVGFAGVFLIVDPAQTSSLIGISCSLIVAITGGMLIIQTKKMSKTETPSAIVFWGLAIAVVVCAFFMPFQWITPNPLDMFVFLSIGFSRAMANFLLAKATKYAPASVVMPIDYTGLVWAMIFGYLIWGDIPTLALYYGATLIILAGLYLAYRENLDEAGIKTSVFNHAYRKLRRKKA